MKGRSAAFRADASQLIGTGHVMRCLTLANQMRSAGWMTHFLCRDQPGHMGDALKSAGHQVHLLKQKQPADNGVKSGATRADYEAWLGFDQDDDAAEAVPILRAVKPEWLVVDHYALGAYWEATMSDYTRRVMVIDDLANRRHDCDILLDQTYGRLVADYDGLVPERTELLCGSQYALLRPEFARLRESRLERSVSPEVNHILVSLGGTDPDNVTGDVLDALNAARLPSACRISVVLGQSSLHADAIMARANTMAFDCEILIGVNDMASLMASCDMAIGAAGSTSWERCCLGVPTIMIVLADNQRLIAKNLVNQGAVLALPAGRVMYELQGMIDLLTYDGERRQLMSQNAAKVTDGHGVWKAIDRMEQSGDS
ncbi:MAG: UDP-2,4-diacetamido-2,4,6-trideoxy-beta-L-altropyranose hydrolase [Pseudomonadota bacterium]